MLNVKLMVLHVTSRLYKVNYIIYNEDILDYKLYILLITITLNYTLISGDRGSTVVKVLRYKSEGHWFDSMEIILPIALWPCGRLSL